MVPRYCQHGPSFARLSAPDLASWGAKLAMLRKAIDAGFDVTLIDIGIASPELSARRVDQRIAIGGHDVPRDRLAARFARSLINLARALAFVPTVQLYDNSSADEPYRPVAAFRRGRLVSRMRGKLPRWALTVLRSAHRRR